MQRRHFVLGTLAGAGALAIGWCALPPRQRQRGSQPLALAAGETAFSGWLKISADDRVLVVCPKSEMGQGVHTGLAAVLADELDADWSRVAVAAAPVDAIYGNVASLLDGLPFHPDDDSAVRRALEWLTAKAGREFAPMLTGGSSSLRDLWLPMREAGAAARAMLVDAAATRWGVPAADIQVARGVLRHASGRQARFGELAAAAGALPIPDAPRLKTPAEFKLIGQPLPRLEAAAKGNGSARFGCDVLPPGLLHASVVMCPTLGGRVAGHDGRAAALLPGVRQVLAFAPGPAGGSGGVAVIADTPWHAMRGADAVQIDWDAGPAAGVSSAALLRTFAAALDAGPGFIYRAEGDVDAALSGAARLLSADYSAPYLAHTALEPVNCTVQVGEGRATVWASTQAPDIARAVVARTLGLAVEQVDVQVQWIGGGFGRRLEVDFIAQAATIAAAIPGQPVQTLWSREQDSRHDFYRPACVARLRAGLDSNGRVVAFSQHSAGQAILLQVMARYAAGITALPLLTRVQAGAARAAAPLQRWVGALPGLGEDKTSVEGAFDQAYEFGAVRVAHSSVEAPVPVGFWRSVGHSHHAFFQECFIDELAHAAGQDALAFRRGLLQRHPRHRAVLERAAAMAAWGQPLAPADDGAPRAQGLALHQSFGAIVAQVAEVSIAADRSTIRVHRVCCAIDCGTAVNPNLVRQQMDSGIVFGLGAALYGEVTIDDGQVRQSNFHDLPALRLADCPRIETAILDSDAPPEGVGEAGVPPIAPAVASALFKLTGQRLRALPLKLARASTGA